MKNIIVDTKGRGREGGGSNINVKRFHSQILTIPYSTCANLKETMEISFTAEGSAETVTTTETIRIDTSVGAVDTSACVEVETVDLGAAAIALHVDTEGKK